MAKQANRLKVLRADKGLSQLDTAIKIGIGRDRYWYIENGYKEATQEERTALAELFGVAETDVFPQPVSA